MCLGVRLLLFAQAGANDVQMNEDKLKPGERCASTSNRNFQVRRLRPKKAALTVSRTDKDRGDVHIS